MSLRQELLLSIASSRQGALIQMSRTIATLYMMNRIVVALASVCRWIVACSANEMTKAGILPVPQEVAVDFNPPLASRELGFPSLKHWYSHLERRWECIAAYFESPTTSALSEGVNNVIKTIKRRAYGYRNMEYFKLKIMQVCGHLTTDRMRKLGYL